MIEQWHLWIAVLLLSNALSIVATAYVKERRGGYR